MTAYPTINDYNFGQITIDTQRYEHDVYIFPDGNIKKRKKWLAKEIYGTSHKIGPNELRYVCKNKPEIVLLGTGQTGAARLTDDGKRYLDKHRIEYICLPTPEIIHVYNQSQKQKTEIL